MIECTESSIGFIIFAENCYHTKCRCFFLHTLAKAYMSKGCWDAEKQCP